MSLSVILLCHDQAGHIPAIVELLSKNAAHISQLILVDDASEDGGAALLERAAGQLARAEFVSHERNIGVLAAMQDALDLLHRHPEAAFCSTATRIIAPDGVDLGEFRASRPLGEPGYLRPDELRNALFTLDSWFMGHATVFHRRMLIEAGAFPVELGGYSDAFMCMRLGLGNGACFSPRVLASKQLHDEPYGSSMYGNDRSEEILSALMDCMANDPGRLFDRNLRKRIAGRWRYNASMLAKRDTSDPKHSIPMTIRKLYRFMRHKPFDLISVLHRRWPNSRFQL
jgi:glycosyltransferase involved in cell wall biosynthesis